MILGIINIIPRVTSKVPIIKKKLPCDNKISYRQSLLSKFIMCSFLNNLSTVIGNNNTIYSKNGFDNRKFHSKLPIIVFQINSISLIESEEFRETSIR